jgi:PadR family transcriptional regulator, regulatory protein PadR
MLRELFLGFIRVHILFHATEGPVYGTELMEELARHGYRIGPGTLYPILHAMAARGYLRYARQVVKGRARKYYRATPAGQRLLAKAQAKLIELAHEALPADRKLERAPTAVRRRTR